MTDEAEVKVLFLLEILQSGFEQTGTMLRPLSDPVPANGLAGPFELTGPAVQQGALDIHLQTVLLM
ncbi:hypothetical protein D9M71_717170 [compost metagenome]